MQTRFLGTRLRQARMSAALTIRELALQLGVSHSALGHWETNRHVPHFRMLVRVARLTEVDVGWIVTGVGALPIRSEAQHRPSPPVAPNSRMRGLVEAELDAVNGSGGALPRVWPRQHGASCRVRSPGAPHAWHHAA